MHEDQPVAELHIETDISLFAMGIECVINKELFPPCFSAIPTSHQLWKWWQARYPDRDRNGLTDMMAYYTHNTIAVYDYSFIHLSLLSYGFSLIDHYWLNPKKTYTSKDFLMHSFPQDITLAPISYNQLRERAQQWDNTFAQIITAFTLDTKHPSILPPIPIWHPQFAIYGNKAKYYKWDNNKLYCYKLYPNTYNGIKHKMENELPMRVEMSEWIKAHNITHWNTETQIADFITQSKFFLNTNEEYYDFVMLCLDKQLDGYDDNAVKKLLVQSGVKEKEVDEWMDEKNQLQHQFGLSDYMFLDNLGIVYNLSTECFTRLFSRL